MGIDPQRERHPGRELAARLARWWIATGRYSDVGQFLTTAAGLPDVADPGIQARVLLGTAWSAYQLGDSPRAAPLAADGKLGITTRTELAAQAASRDLTARSDGLPRSLPPRYQVATRGDPPTPE